MTEVKRIDHLGLEVDNLDAFVKNVEEKGYAIAVKDENGY